MESVEVSDRHVGLRIAATVLLLIIAVLALTYGISALTAADKGWQNISPASGASDYASEFLLTYNVGASGVPAKSESRGVKAAYTDALAKVGKALDPKNVYEGNLAALNASPNTVMTLDPALYAALEKLQTFGDRTAFLGPAFHIYDNIFQCAGDHELEGYDPEQNEQLRALFAKIAAFASDPESVDIRLLGDGRAELAVSREYLSFLTEEEIGPAVDLYWMRNAFIVDYAADALAGAGFTCGVITSADGYARNLGCSGESFSLNIFSLQNGKVVEAGRLNYAGPLSMVSFRTFPVSNGENWYYYVTEQGGTKHRYLSLRDGLPAETLESLTAVSDTLSCAEIMLRCAPLWSDKDGVQKFAELAGTGVNAICPQDGNLWVTDPEMDLTDVYAGFEIREVK